MNYIFFVYRKLGLEERKRSLMQKLLRILFIIKLKCSGIWLTYIFCCYSLQIENHFKWQLIKMSKFSIPRIKHSAISYSICKSNWPACKKLLAKIQIDLMNTKLILRKQSLNLYKTTLRLNEKHPLIIHHQNAMKIWLTLNNIIWILGKTHVPKLA